MSPAILGLLLATSLSFWTAGLPAARPTPFLTTPLDARLPAVVLNARDRSRHLHAAIPQARAIERLLWCEDLRRFHATTARPVDVPIGTVDPDLVVGLAWLGIAATAGEADSRLSRTQKLAVLTRREGLEKITAMAPGLSAAA